jgi:1-acyl-sn-glycerol-3-phosphate acyltransferase
MIGYPHTSNWDVPLGLLVNTALGVRLQWVGKHTLFKKPLGYISRWTGGIPINRETTKNFVQEVADVFKEHERLVITLSPEGTRGKTDFWRTGFYYIALGAGVPIACAFLDYKNKRGGFGPLIYPSGDLEKDFEQFRAFYSDIRGKYPELMGNIRPSNAPKGTNRNLTEQG